MSIKNNRPYNNYNNKKRNNNRNHSNYNGNKKRKPQKVNLENTTRIRIDNERMNDFESLDTSFLEGRLDKKIKKNKKAKEKILLEQKRFAFNLEIIKRVFFVLALTCIFVLAVILFLNSDKIKTKEKIVEEKKEEKEVIKVDIDDNYLFIGDRYTEALNFEDLDYHYVKVSEDNLKIKDVLDDMKKKVYRYNPTIVFIELGFTDLKDDRDIEKIVEDLEKVVDGIKENRPYAKIYVESLYPINKNSEDYDENSLREDLDNDNIIEINKLIFKMTKDKNVKYLDVFSLLEKDDKINEKYTDDGVKLNDEGNTKILEKIEEIVG